MHQPSRRLRVAVVNDHDVVIAGLRTVLRDEASVVVVGDDPAVDEVDVVLLDTFGDPRRAERVERLREAGLPVAVFGWSPPPATATGQPGALPALGFVAKDADREQLVAALHRVAGGHAERVDGAGEEQRVGAWPGAEEGLSAREAEVVALVAQGLTNEEVAGRLFLSTNTIKTYIRTAYRTMDVTSRSQAVIWAVEHGLGGGAGWRRTAPPAERVGQEQR